jgi:hypothetical protein
MKLINFWKPIIIPFVHVQIDPNCYGIERLYYIQNIV